MIDERIIDKLVERIVDRIESGNSYVLEQIGKNIKKVGTLTPTNAQRIGQIIKYGGNYDKIVQELARITKINIEDIYEVFEEVGKSDYLYAKQFYDYKGKKYIPFEENIALQNEIRAMAKITADEYRNLSLTRAFTKIVNGKRVYTDLSRTYQDTIDEAIISIMQGKDTFNNQMTKTIRELANSGIRTVDYGKRYSRRLDSAVRMNLKGGLRDLHNKIQEIVGEEFGADGVEISVHINPAPDHQFVQGRQFSTEEFNKFQNNQDSRDYTGRLFTRDYKGHDRRSISEYNCYHYVFSIILGASIPNYSTEELQDIINNNNKGFEFDGEHYTNYEGTQMQRQIETEIRKTKDLQIIASSSGNLDLVNESQLKIRQLTKKYRDLSVASGLPTKKDRLKVSGYKRRKI